MNMYTTFKQSEKLKEIGLPQDSQYTNRWWSFIPGITQGYEFCGTQGGTEGRPPFAAYSVGGLIKAILAHDVDSIGLQMSQLWDADAGKGSKYWSAQGKDEIEALVNLILDMHGEEPLT